MTLRADPDSQNVIPERRYVHNGLAAPNFDAIAQRPDSGDGLKHCKLFPGRDGCGGCCLLAER
jgi:hypothetical protein